METDDTDHNIAAYLANTFFQPPPPNGANGDKGEDEVLVVENKGKTSATSNTTVEPDPIIINDSSQESDGENELDVSSIKTEHERTLGNGGASSSLSPGNDGLATGLASSNLKIGGAASNSAALLTESASKPRYAAGTIVKFNSKEGTQKTGKIGAYMPAANGTNYVVYVQSSASKREIQEDGFVNSEQIVKVMPEGTALARQPAQPTKKPAHTPTPRDQPKNKRPKKSAKLAAGNASVRKRSSPNNGPEAPTTKKPKPTRGNFVDTADPDAFKACFGEDIWTNFKKGGQMAYVALKEKQDKVVEDEKREQERRERRRREQELKQKLQELNNEKEQMLADYQRRCAELEKEIESSK